VTPAVQRVALVGYGEVGRIFGAALAQAGVHACAYDILGSDPGWRAIAAAHADGRVELASTARDAVRDSPLVICAVTAAATQAAAAQIAQACPTGAFVLDVNSASPRTKRACAELVDAAGGRYVEAAVMTSVPPHGIRVPMLLGGPHAGAALPLLEQLGFAASVGSTSYGVVSAIKLCRSVVIKGMEALAVESMLAARRYGVEREVLASLVETFPTIDWDRQMSYFWQRVVQHGRRRSEEMREAAVTVRDVGIEPSMAAASADVQAWIAKLRADGVFDGRAAKADWRELADAISDLGESEQRARRFPEQLASSRSIGE
jgi:3-hydroxyisobutyrate dehydrogenase-like beta-hydroxyacid dehydrogenase